jgi:Fic family protein
MAYSRLEYVPILMDQVFTYLRQRFPADENPSREARLVLLALCCYLSKTDSTPGVYTLENLERMTQLSQPTIRKHLREWERRGVLKAWQERWGHNVADEFSFFPWDSVIAPAPAPARPR